MTFVWAASCCWAVRVEAVGVEAAGVEETQAEVVEGRRIELGFAVGT